MTPQIKSVDVVLMVAAAGTTAFRIMAAESFRFLFYALLKYLI